MKDTTICALALAVLLSLSPQPALSIDWDWCGSILKSSDKSIAKAAEQFNGGDVDSCIVTLNMAKAQTQDDCRVRHVLYDVYMDQKRFQDAKSEMSDLISVEQRLCRTFSASARPPFIDVSSLRCEYGDIFSQEKDYSSAIQQYKEASALAEVEKEKNWFPPHIKMGIAYEAMGELSQAKQCFVEAMKSPSMPTDTRRNLQQKIAQLDESSATQPRRADGGGATSSASGPTLASAGGLPATSFTGITSSFGAQPAVTPAQAAPVSSQTAAPTKKRPADVTQAIQSMNVSDYNSAAKILKDYLTKNNKNGEAHYLLAVSYANLKRNPEAAAEYEEAMNYADSFNLQKMAAQGLAKVKGKP